jgi:hypothetical protein
LAGHRAALSVSATVGVAVATLLVVGGILAGPAILECSRDSNGFGACLRDKAADTGLIAPDAERTERPDVVADVSSEPPLPPAPMGWMEAAANEYEAPASVPVDLAATAAGIAAMEAEPVSEAPVEVAIVPPTELATATPVVGTEMATVTLDGAEPGLMAEGVPSGEAAPVGEVALAGPQGAVTAMAPTPEAAIDGAAALAAPDGLLVESPIVIDEPVAAPVELQAEVSVAPVEAPPPVAVEFNPQYPNVLVLPPPAEGDNSSFRSLQLN